MIVLITGAASGIGNYIAKQYHLNNYQVIGLDKDHISLSGINHVQIDLCNARESEKTFSQFNHIDLAINCAGVSSTRKPFIDFDTSELITCISQNLNPVINSLKEEIKIMKKQSQGKIINIASFTGHVGMRNFAAYSAAKAAIINLTKVAAIEHAEDNIRINSISPATIDTPMIRKKYNNKLRDYSDVFYTNNCGTVEDVYSIVKMLESNNFMTGNDIKLDGGLTDLFTI